jgi:hypothetical protein
VITDDVACVPNLVGLSAQVLNVPSKNCTSHSRRSRFFAGNDNGVRLWRSHPFEHNALQCQQFVRLELYLLGIVCAVVPSHVGARVWTGFFNLSYQI